MRRTPIAVACCALAALLPAPAAAATHNWTRFGFNAARQNFSTANAGIAAGDLSHLKRQDVGVPGTVDSSAIYFHAVHVAGKTRDVFIATTSYGRTFALDAGSGKRLWTFTPPGYNGFKGTYQITHSSPVGDAGTGFVWAAAPDGRIRKLRLIDGAPVTSGSWPAVITKLPEREKIGTALNLTSKFVIATTGGYNGDTPPYQGHVVLIDRGTGAIVRVFNTLCSNRSGLILPATCTESGSAVWARSGAAVIPGSGRILISTGDGNFNGQTNWGDSVLELSPDPKKLVGNWTPTNYASLDVGDIDLGSTAPALLKFGDKWLALQGGKDGKMRLLRTANLNGHGKACKCTGGELQTFDPPGAGIYTAPAVWRHNSKTWVFIANLTGGTSGYRLDSDRKLHRIWSNGRDGTSPVIAGGLLWVYSPSGGTAVYRPASGKLLKVLGSSGGHWNSPIVADGRVAIPVGDANDGQTSGTLTIYRKPS